MTRGAAQEHRHRHRGPSTATSRLSQHTGLWVGVIWGWGLLGQWCPLGWQCPYLDKVLVDPFGEGFLLDTISLICKRGEGQVSQWHQGRGTAKNQAPPVAPQGMAGTGNDEPTALGNHGESRGCGERKQLTGIGPSVPAPCQHHASTHQCPPAPASTSVLSTEIRSAGQSAVLITCC